MSIQRNVLYNLFAATIPIIISLVTIPIYINCIGDIRYGIIVLLWSFLGYFSVFDFGLGRATTQRIANQVDVSRESSSKIFCTALLSNALIGCLGGICAWITSSRFFDMWLNIAPNLSSELKSSLPWLLIGVPLVTISGVCSGALQAYELFYKLSIINLIGSILLQCVPLLIAKIFGPNLFFLITSIFSVKIFILILLLYQCQKIFLKDFKSGIDVVELRHLLTFGGWVTLSALIEPILIAFDKMVIGALINTRSVTYYSVPYELSEKTNIVSGSLTSVLFPKFSASSSTAAKIYAYKAITSLSFITTPIIVFLILGSDYFLEKWMGSEFASNTHLTAQILLAGFWINGVAFIPFSFIQGTGNPRLIAQCHLVEVVPYMVLLYMGVVIWGLPGAAIAFTLRVFTDFFLLMWASGLSKNYSFYILSLSFFVAFAVVLSSLQNEYTTLWNFHAILLILIVLVLTWYPTPQGFRKILSHAIKVVLDFVGV